MFELVSGSNNVQKGCVALSVVLTYTILIFCKDINILLICKEISDFFCVKTLWTKLL